MIIAKSKWDKKQMEERIARGADAIEVQFFEEFIEKMKLDVEEMYDMSVLDAVRIENLHMPLADDFSYDLEYNVSQKIFKKMCELAQFIAQKQGHDVCCIIHSRMSYDDLEHIGMLNYIRGYLLDIVNKYKNVHIAVENIMPADYIGGKMHLYDNFNFDNVAIVKYCNHSRIGTVIDTCHVYASQKILSMIDNYYFNAEPIGLAPSISDYFKANKCCCKLIHLNNLEGNGNLGFNHSTGFNIGKPRDYFRMKEIVECYYKLNYKCNFVIEVREDDYMKCENFSHTKECLEKIQSIFWQMNVM